MPNTPEADTKTSFAYIDLDGFSEINNEHGHSFGDQVLEKITRFGSEFVDENWEFDREYGQGGDEFLIEMPEVDKDSAEDNMEEFRRGLKNLEPNGIQVTASIGIATQPIDETGRKDTIDAADKAMLNAEKWGGDEVIVAGEERVTEEVSVWFEEHMRIDEGDLVELQLWIDRYPSQIRAAEIYNKTKEMKNRSSIAGTFMSVDKVGKPIGGVVSDIKKENSSEIEFDMVVEASRLEELGLV